MDLGSKKRTSKTNDSSSSTSNLNSNIAIAQYNANAILLDEFEQSEKSGKSFDYTNAVKLGLPNSVPLEKMDAYLDKIQRGGLIQPFGCTIVVEIPTFIIIAYSENIIDMLGIIDLNVGSLLGFDARSLFTPSAGDALSKAAFCREISLLNPIWVNSIASKRPFYAILHRINVGFVIDLEPAQLCDPVFSIAGAMQSQKLAVRAISRLQSLPQGDIGVLCDTIAENVKELTGYDRVMVYKFHEDEHGEVVSEIKRPDLEPYLGLHYPATDIPQVARFLFKQNRCRMIYDCHAKPVGIIQNEKLKQPLCLINSTLRSPHDCHTQYMVNMGSLSSLVMAVVVNRNESTRLWGLVVCHHSSCRYIPYPLRHACEFLMQAFGLQLNMELQIAAQLAEKNILKMQTLLCEMLLRNAPDGIVTQSPNIMDFVKCDGAAMYIGGTCWLLGVTPTKEQIKDIANWLLTYHADSTGFSTDSLSDVGYPGAALLGDEVCGMASARIPSKDFLFWFRSHTAKEVKWAGAKHHPEDKDYGGRMHPRSSFKAFLDGVKRKSYPWEIYEKNGIQSLQLIMRRSFQNTKHYGAKAMIHTQLKDSEIQGMDNLSSASPIFASDDNVRCCQWNAAMEKLTGWTREEAIGKILIGEIFGGFCQLKSQDAFTKFMILIHRAIVGEETEKLPFAFFNKRGKYVEVLLTTIKRTDMSGKTIGCFCFLHETVSDSEKAFQVQRQWEKKWFARLEELKYSRQEMRNSLNGIRFTHQLLEATVVSTEEKLFLRAGDACERQLMNIIDDMEFGSMEESRMKLKNAPFLLGSVLDAILCQVMILMKERNLQLVHDISEEYKTLSLYGDRIRLQQVLSVFLQNVVNHVPNPGGRVEIKVTINSKLREDGNLLAHLEFRMAHPGEGLPSEVIRDMFEEGTRWATHEGFRLRMARKILKLMRGGHVRYIREPSKCYFLIEVEFKATRIR